MPERTINYLVWLLSALAIGFLVISLAGTIRSDMDQTARTMTQFPVGR